MFAKRISLEHLNPERRIPESTGSDPIDRHVEDCEQEKTATSLGRQSERIGLSIRECSNAGPGGLMLLTRSILLLNLLSRGVSDS